MGKDGRYTLGFLQLVPVNYHKQYEYSTRLLVTVKQMFSRQLVSPHQEYDQGPI